MTESGAFSAKMKKTCISRAENAVLENLVNFLLKIAKKWGPRTKKTKLADLGLKTSVLYQLFHFAKNR